MLFQILLYSTSLWILAKSDIYTALVDLEPLLETEGEILRTLDKYLELEDKRLESVRGLRKEYEKLHNAAMDNVDSFLSNPANAYLLVKRLTTDWQTAVQLIEAPTSKAVIENISKLNLRFPDNEDLKGATYALMRLQDTYLLDTATLANGEIAGTNRSMKFTAGDCFEIGYQAHIKKDHYHAALWMQEALDRLKLEDVKSISKQAVLEHMAHATYMMGNTRHAVKLTRDILIAEPSHLPSLENLKFYEDQAELQEGRNGALYNEIQEMQDILLTTKEPYESFHEYVRLCRGERTKSPDEESRFYCHYTTGKSPYLMLQPIKVEILSFDPWIMMYHDVLSNEDANMFKQMAQPMLTRAKLQNPKTGKMENSSYRTGTTTWLRDEMHPRVEHASRMIEEITGLNTKTAEQLHIVNYGIGGHYEPHHDYRKPGKMSEANSIFETNGNRIATWIYYLTDVGAGGATVFPDIGVTITPRKGSAAFWYNLKKSGDLHEQTKHAGCPVLAGTKWIANKWLHELDQEYRRPCSLNRYELM